MILQRVAMRLTHIASWSLMDAYSEDLRKKIVEAVEKRGMKKSEAARLFGVSLSSVKRYVRKFRQAPPEMRVPQSTGGIEGEQIYSLPRSQTDRVHQKKRAVGASERNEWLRAAWKVTVAGVLDPRRLVFVDECGTHVSLARIYGYSARGERVRLKVPRNRGKNTTLLASMSTEGMGPCLADEGSTTAEVFEAYLEHSLAPKLKEGQVVVMDNLAAHKPDSVREVIEDRACELVYLPPYSPDYNPIEEAFSKIKGVLRDAQARTRRTLVEAMGQALSTVTAQDATGFFEHCGYPHL